MIEISKMRSSLWVNEKLELGFHKLDYFRRWEILRMQSRGWPEGCVIIDPINLLQLATFVKIFAAN